MRQIDGLGGADPLTSKVAIVSRSHRSDADVDYLFAQVVVGEGRVDTSPNCGNILAAVAPFAIEMELAPASKEATTPVRIHMVNSGDLCEVIVPTANGRVEYEGTTAIDGVPGTSAPIVCNYLDVAGSVCGTLLPTRNALDFVDGIEVTCIDNGMPVVVLRAGDLDRTGYESPEALDSDEELKQRLELLRRKCGLRMNLGDVTDKVVPKMCLIAPPRQAGHVCTRTFIPRSCHPAIGVLGAVSVATACIIPGSVAHSCARASSGENRTLSIEHPSGEFTVRLHLDVADGDTPLVVRAGVIRTARLLFRGELFVPASVWNGSDQREVNVTQPGRGFGVAPTRAEAGT
jgi:4-oxalomesaconate tautomerase